MGQAVATLSGEMRLDTGGLQADAARAMGITNRLMADAVNAYERIDKAAKAASDPTAAIAGAARMADAIERASTSSAGNLGKVAAAVKAAGDTSAAVEGAGRMGAAFVQAGEVTTAAQRKTETMGERLIAQWNRQAEAIGKTPDQLRQVRAEEAALAATRSGNADLAARILAAEQNIWAAEAQAARAARIEAENLAQEREAAADKAAASAALEARALMDAAAAHRAFEAAARSGMAAMREQEADAERLAAAAQRLRASLDPVGAAQARMAAELADLDRMFLADLLTLDQYTEAEQRARAQMDATTASIERQAAASRAAGAASAHPASTAGATNIGPAEASAAVFKEAADAAAQLEQRIKALTAAVDPQAAAMARANALVAEARDLDDGTAAATDRVAKAEANLARVHEAAAKSAGTNSFALTNLSFQLNDVATMASMGASPMQILATQGGQVFQAFQMAEGGAMALARQIGALVLAFAPFLVIGTVIAAAVASWYGYASAMQKVTDIAQGAGAVIGVTGTQLEQISERAATAAGVSVSASRDIVTGYVQAGGIGKDVLGDLVGLTEGFARATGTDAADAQKTLAAAFQDPVKGAQDLTVRYGSLTQAQIDHIQQLVEQNDKYGAQAALLHALQPQFDGAAQHAQGLAAAWRSISTAASDAWTSMGKTIALALGGGTTLDKLNAKLQDRSRFLTQTMGGGDTSGLDQQIATLRAQLAREQAQAASDNQARAARSAIQQGMAIAGKSTGDDALQKLKTDAGLVAGALKAAGQQAGFSADGLAQLTTAQQQYTHAVNSYLAPADKAAKIAALDAEMEANKKNPAMMRSLTVQKAMIEQSGQLVTGAQAQAKASGEGAKAYQAASNTLQNAADAAAKKAANHRAELERSAQAEEAQITGLGKLAKAYGESGAAALVAEATERANVKAIKDRGDAEAEISRQIRIAIAQRITDAAKATAGMADQASVQEQVNAKVRAGLVPQAAAAQMVQQMTALLPAQVAQQAALEQAKAASDKGDTVRAAAFQAQAAQAAAGIAAETAAQQRLNAAKMDAQILGSIKGGNDQLADLRAELSLIGQTDAARVHALATLRAMRVEQDLIAQGADPAKAAEAARIQVAVADQAEKNRQAQEAYNQSLDRTAALWGALAENMNQAASDASQALGGWGKALSGVAASYTDLQARQSELDRAKTADLKKWAGNDKALADTEKLYATKGALLQVKAYGDMAAAGQSFFKKGSAGYKAMGVASQVFRALELAMAIKSTLQQIGLIGSHTAADTAATTSSVINSGVRAQADGAAAVAKTASSVPFPGNIAAVAAVVGLLASFGIMMAGKGGGGGGAAAYAASNTGTGTVLGDSSAASESIKNSIDALKDVDTVMLSNSRDMLQSLRSIDNGISQLATSVISAGNIGGIVGVSNSGGGLFGTKSTIIGQGVYGGAQSLGTVMASGAYGTDYYADVEKKKKFLGITTGTKFSTQYASDGSGIDQQFGLLLKGFADTVKAAAGPLGVATDTVTQRLDAFVVNIGKIDLTGLKGDEITKKLEAVFSAEGDKIAAAAIPGLQRYQQAGEGYLQTLTRVASTVETVTATLEKLGTATNGLGIDASMGIAKQFDSVSDFSSAADAYFQAFYTDAEQAAAKSAQLGKVFASLGLAMPDTMAGFRGLVEAQDLTTASGQRTYATLLQVAPAFADVAQAANGAKSAADVLSERADLERQLLDIAGDTDAIRALDLQKIDQTNRALQQQVWAQQDAKDAADKAAQAEEALATQRTSLEDQLIQLQGDVATQRERELAALDPSLRALKQQIYALTDQQAAATAAAQATQAQAQAEQQLASQRASLEGQVLELTGNTAEMRRRELAALDPSLQAIQQNIYALTDLKAAQDAAAAAADAAAQKADAFAAERGGITDEILQLQGDTAAQRFKELQALDPANRALKEYVYTLQDAQTAAQAAAQVEQEKQGLMGQLWQLTGDTASIRAAQLASLDVSNRALQQQIYDITDAQAAAADQQQQAQAAASAAQQLSDAWASVGSSIVDEVKRIRGLLDPTGVTSFASLQGQFNGAILAARAGDQDAAKSLPGLSQSLLDQAAKVATSRQELARVQAETAAALDSVASLIAGGVATSQPGAGDMATADGSSWWSQYTRQADTAAAQVAANDPRDDEVAELRATIEAMGKDTNDKLDTVVRALALIIGNTGEAADILNRALRAGNGALAVVDITEAAA